MRCPVKDSLAVRGTSLNDLPCRQPSFITNVKVFHSFALLLPVSIVLQIVLVSFWSSALPLFHHPPAPAPLTPPTNDIIIIRRINVNFYMLTETVTTMKTKNDLHKLLLSIDHRGYPAYKETRGKWSYGNYILSIDHVQGDPFASPSNVSVIVPGSVARFPREYFAPGHRLITLQDTLLRLFGKEIRGRERRRDGSGKSGLIDVSRPGQEVLERTACRVDPRSGDVTVRFEIGFPANGRSINARALIQILDEFLPEAVSSSLICQNIDAGKLLDAINLSDDQAYIRSVLDQNGLCAFVGDGSVLPRVSGVSSLPMKDAVPFVSPEAMAVTLTLPHAGTMRGMGVRKGVTLIVGGGYHGKSTLLGALEKGVYDHIRGDGREYVITDGSAVKVRAEDGRCITNVDISLFIRDLPNGKDTVRFSTEDASGSTSQAANVIESVESGAKLLLIDEDTSATNFMVRDELMARVVSGDKEPITPFISRIRDLYEKAGISTILVAGSSGAFFHVADTVVQMDRYIPVEITDRAKMAASGLDSSAEADAGAPTDSDSGSGTTAASIPASASADVYRASGFRLPSVPRVPNKNNALLREGRIKTKVLSNSSFLIAHDELDLRGLEQLVDREQVAALAQVLKYMELHLIDGRTPFGEVVDRMLALIDSRGLEELFDGSTVRCGLAGVRKAEIAGMLNRYRRL